MKKLEAHGESLKSDIAAIGADLANISGNLDLLTERVARLPTKGFLISATMIQIALLSGVILFGEKLKAMLEL